MTIEGHAEAMSAPLPSCCAHHSSQLPTGCDQGRDCPERARRESDAPEPDCWAWLYSLKPAASYAALVIAVLVLLALILWRYF
jgi:hypothetical protein